eukprot:scaffold2192_cov98-Skeletonema_dohrnii-CCMP3373.AAC.3
MTQADVSFVSPHKSSQTRGKIKTTNIRSLFRTYVAKAHQREASQMSVAIYNGFQILPLILVFASSCVRAALRIKGLIPESLFSTQAG